MKFVFKSGIGLASLVLLGQAVRAEETTASLVIGGPGTCSSAFFDDPGRLNDGVTEGHAILDFVYDDLAAELTLTVTNTSPVIVGESNPVITRIYFNAPMAVTDMVLTDQTGSGGLEPDFTLVFDADVTSFPNPNAILPFGRFSAAVEVDSVLGGIYNPDADTLPLDPEDLVQGPATFTFDVFGAVGGLTAASFANIFSFNNPNNPEPKPVCAAAKFRGGGPSGNAFGTISNDPGECFLVAGTSEGADFFEIYGPEAHLFPTAVAGIRSFRGMTMAAPAEIRLTRGMFGAYATRAPAAWGGPPSIAGAFSVQGLMWNPDDYPENPEQWSTGVNVFLWTNGQVTWSSYGDQNGLTLGVELLHTSQGQPYLRFPFQVEGM